ncbi:MAG: tRNA uracil 4-sulfurtransferase ThiI [Nanoarchaeota archaeon]|nr:tRNA uracil 4-sulfurtransferase ThiI [Nanoarchaeota archaeon]
MDSIIIHYGEIAIKKGRRSYFEELLTSNIKKSLKQEAIKEIKRLYGRILITLTPESNIPTILEKLGRIPGINNYAVAQSCPLDLEAIKKTVIALVAEKQPTSFAIRTKKATKKILEGSQVINNLLGEAIITTYGWKVDLEHPELPITIEMTDQGSYISLEKHESMGGLPVGSAGTVTSLLSGGIDSPVASYLLMKRGCRIVFVHIYNKTVNSEASLNKIYDLVNQLKKYQGTALLYIVPFTEIQDAIIMKTPAAARMLLYRRCMLDLAEAIAKKEQAGALVTGENLGQVASQTLPNLAAIEAHTTLPIFRPLIGHNKDEIIKEAKKIGTYDISIQPYGDCCSYMIAEHPTTNATITDIDNLEKTYNKKQLIEKALQETVVKKFT